MPSNTSRRMYRRLSAPISVQLEVTTNCNNTCRHCYNYWRGIEGESREDKNGNMSLETAQLVAEQCIRQGVFDFIITGGEPFYNFSVIDYLTTVAANAGLRVSVNTNLTIVTKERAKWIGSKRVGILTSILGPNADVHDRLSGRSGAFKETMRGFRLCSEQGIIPAVNMVVNLFNYNLVRETARMLADEGCRYMTVTRTVCPGYVGDFASLDIGRENLVSCLNDLCWARDNLELRIDTLNSLPLCALSGVEDPIAFSSRRCGAGIRQVAISSNGEVRGCPHVDTVEGNLHEQSFSEIWEKMSNWGEENILPEECRSCSLIGRCGGGCRFAAKMSCGSLCGHDPLMDQSQIPLVEDSIRIIDSVESLDSDQFSVNYLRVRKEPFGSIVAVGPYHNNTFLLDHRGTELIMTLKPGEKYEVESWKNIPDGAEFLRGLVARGVVNFLL